MAIHSSTIAWKIPWTEEPGRLQSMGSQSQTRLSDFTSLRFGVVGPHITGRNVNRELQPYLTFLKRDYAEGEQSWHPHVLKSQVKASVPMTP